MIVCPSQFPARALLPIPTRTQERVGRKISSGWLAILAVCLLFAHRGPAATVAYWRFEGDGTNAPTTPITLVNPYGLTNSSTITLTGGSLDAMSQAGWNASTTVVAAPIPEPASIALLLTALPVTLFGAVHRRKAAE